jgi:L-ribulose-5-phosphate 4-epimerase
VEYAALRAEAFEANRALGASGLVVLTWGNVSAVDRAKGVYAIKPSGVPYDALTVEEIVVVDIESGETVAGNSRPSSDSKTHRELYLAFSAIGGVTHTHSTYATAWAQAGCAIPCLGTTHADTFHGRIPVTRDLTAAEIDSDYEGATGRVIAGHFEESGIDPLHTPSVLLPHHGPFTWGRSASASLEHAVILEAVARLASLTRSIVPEVKDAPEPLVRKHFERKHGPKAYYGQG